MAAVRPLATRGIHDHRVLGSAVHLFRRECDVRPFIVGCFPSVQDVVEITYRDLMRIFYVRPMYCSLLWSEQPPGAEAQAARNYNGCRDHDDQPRGEATSRFCRWR